VFAVAKRDTILNLFCFLVFNKAYLYTNMSGINVPGFTVFRHCSPHQEQHQNKGQIQVIFGPMFSGKTTELLRRIKRYQVATYNCLVIKYENDKRYVDNGVSTHDRQTYKAISCSKLMDIFHHALKYEVIGVDEGQFFPDVVKFCEEMAKHQKIVVVAALDGDFQRKPFGNILELVPFAESVVKLNAVCMNCYGEGSFTKRLCSDTAVEVIGGADKYMAACRDCHAKNLNIDMIERQKMKMQESRKPLLSVENLFTRVKENASF